MSTATPVATRANELLALWSRLSAQHVSLGAGCGCGAGGVTVRLEDFERDIADYLLGESERLNEAAVLAFIADGPPLETRPQPVLEILTRLDAGAASPEVEAWLLKRLARTLNSFAKLHGPTGGEIE